MICGVLMGALYFQYGLNEDPCPLCLLQRMGMIGVVFGLTLNIYFGFDAKHFALIIISAIVGGIFSARQILIHIVPAIGDDGYGTPIFGMHLYTWGLIIFLASILGSSIFLFFNHKFKSEQFDTILKFEKYVAYLAISIVIINVIGTFFECQFGPCCENGPCK